MATTIRPAMANLVLGRRGELIRVWTRAKVNEFDGMVESFEMCWVPISFGCRPPPEVVWETNSVLKRGNRG